MGIFTKPVNFVLSKSPYEALPTISGVATFYGTCVLSMWPAKAMLGLSTGSPPPLAFLYGLATVSVASVISHQTALALEDYQATREWRWGRYVTSSAIKITRHKPSAESWSKRLRLQQQQPKLDVLGWQIPHHTLRVCALGFAMFTLLGGRAWRTLPSSFTHVGSFAKLRASLPATEQYATAVQRTKLEILGRWNGCHTCGTHKLFSMERVKFVADHQPPKAVALQERELLWRKLFPLNRPWPMRFYPQCLTCSTKQGSLLGQATTLLRKTRAGSLAAAGGGRHAHFHGFRPRVYHLTGAGLALNAVRGATEQDLVDENQGRYRKQQDAVEKWVLRQYRAFFGGGSDDEL